MRGFRRIVATSLLLTSAAVHAQTQPASAPEKLIIDSDFAEFNDDGQALMLAANAQADGKVQLLGLTLVTGNFWLEEEEPAAIKAIDRLGLDKLVPIFAGAQGPLLHDHASFEQEKALLGTGDGFWGAWLRPRPASAAIDPAAHAHIQAQNAVDFIIDAVRKNPHQVTIIAIGPMTNIALAIRKAPDIVPLIKRIVEMGGAFDVPGNTMPAAEFNIWFDPEAAKIVWRAPIEHVIVPLDVTNSAQVGRETYDRIAAANPAVAEEAHSLVAMYLNSGRKLIPLWDQLAMAYVLDPSFATKIEERWVDVDTGFGLNYGRTMGYRHVMPGNAYLMKAKIVTGFDVPRFQEALVQTLSRPLPVRTLRPH